jgi:hypothetical protein
MQPGLSLFWWRHNFHHHLNNGETILLVKAFRCIFYRRSRSRARLINSTFFVVPQASTTGVFWATALNLKERVSAESCVPRAALIALEAIENAI